MRKVGKFTLIVVATYLVLVVGIEVLIASLGRSHAERGVAENEGWLTITTTDETGREIDSVIAAFEFDERLYVAANHWPRSWFNRAAERPNIRATLDGIQSEYRAELLDNSEIERVAQVYTFPLWFRFLTGFPPRAYLRLDPR